MALKHLLAGTAAVVALATGTLAAAQTTATTTTSSSTASDGTMTKKTVHVRKHRTHHVKRILGVKVGHKTRTSKTVKETKTNADGTMSTSVKTTTK